MRSSFLVLLIALEGSAHAGGGAFGLPPVEVDVGANAAIGGGSETQVATEVLAGVHWASLYWKPTRFEVGIGYVGSFRPLVRDVFQYASEMPVHHQDRFDMNGAYLTLGHTIYASPHVRTWFELRGELMRASLDDRTFSVLGEAARIASEVYVQTADAAGGSGGGGAIAGTLAIGVYVEASHRDIDRALGPNGFATGVSVRLPFMFLAWN